MFYMAGSLRAFLYTADDGEQYKIFRDESNTETVNSTSTQEDGIPPAGTPTLPDRWETRYALLYQATNPSIKRRVTILSQEVFSNLTGGTDYSLAVVGAAPANFRISSLIGERRLGLTNVDTQQNDGDSENTDETDNDDE
jgi:hypothetical protein